MMNLVMNFFNNTMLLLLVSLFIALLFIGAGVLNITAHTHSLAESMEEFSREEVVGNVGRTEREIAVRVPFLCRLDADLAVLHNLWWNGNGGKLILQTSTGVAERKRDGALLR